MFISHKSNVIQAISDTKWDCRRQTKGLSKPDCTAWEETIKDADGVPDYSGETGYTIIECIDENVRERLIQLNDYKSLDRVYNIKWQDDIGDAEEILDNDGKNVLDEDGEKTYVQSHFVPDVAAKDARILAEEWTKIRTERDKLLTNSDWTQGADSPLTSAKKTAWATYRTKLRDVPKDQKDKTTYASITWPSEPS